MNPDSRLEGEAEKVREQQKGRQMKVAKRNSEEER